MTTDPDIGRALDEIAARAPDPNVLRARLDGRIRAHRRRRTILATAAVVGVGAAVGVPAILAQRRRPVDNDPPDMTRAPLRLRPTWVPDGLVAFSRSASVDGGQVKQEWLTPEHSAQRLLTILPARQFPAVIFHVRRPWAEPSSAYYPLDKAPNTTVAGRPAVYESGNGFSLTWVIADDVLATAEAHTSDPTDVHRLAESVVEDNTACEVAIQPGWLPTFDFEGIEKIPQGPLIEVRGTAQHWLQRAGYPRAASISLAYVGSAEEIPRVFDQAGLRGPYEDITLRRGPARVRYTPSGSGVEERAEVIFDLPDGRVAQVKSYFPFHDPATLRANTIRVAEELSIGPNPDLHWLGRPLP
jgi:hypothetical protein